MEFSDQRNVVIQFVKFGSHEEASHWKNIIAYRKLVLKENVQVSHCQMHCQQSLLQFFAHFKDAVHLSSARLELNARKGLESSLGLLVSLGALLQSEIRVELAGGGVCKVKVIFVLERLESQPN